MDMVQQLVPCQHARLKKIETSESPEQAPAPLLDGLSTEDGDGCSGAGDGDSAGAQ